ncbi:MAG: cation:proton antiporter [Clostridia bacterium]|nr:cation:proton antiporter [Clostridia bacterium]
MLSASYLFDIAIILLSTKFLGLATRKFNMPQVVGALMAGLVLGPSILNITTQTDVLKALAELGVILLMFNAGMSTDVQDLKKSGKASLVIAAAGVIVPMLAGFGYAQIFNPGLSHQQILQNIFIGVVLTATSVSITVETLNEMGKLHTHSGNAILGAAIIDDLIGIIVLAVVMEFSEGKSGIGIIIAKILGFFIFAAIAHTLIQRILIPIIDKRKGLLRRYLIVELSICFLMAYAAEKIFGVSDITGAFAAGIMFSTSKKSSYALSKMEPLSVLLLSPLFFASVGLKIDIKTISWQMALMTLLLLIVAIASKIIGCGLGAKVMGYTNLQSKKIGVGMVPRGEVALIVINKGLQAGIVHEQFLAPLLVSIIGSAIITPIWLKQIYKKQAKMKYEDHMLNSALIDNITDREHIEALTESVVYSNEKLNRENSLKNKKKKNNMF